MTSYSQHVHIPHSIFHCASLWKVCRMILMPDERVERSPAWICLSWAAATRQGSVVSTCQNR